MPLQATLVNSGSQTIEVSIPDYEPVPKMRMNRAKIASILIFAVTAALAFAFCIAKRYDVVYKLDATQTNATNKCYVREEILSFPALLSTALSLFGVVLGTLVDRYRFWPKNGFTCKSATMEAVVKCSKLA